ncbi:MAG TPA: TonB-system energizer ExbB [Campylobacterales bacterium]|nr:TonB-system energizer ExbB [Campylobacterales bacterium]
MEHLTNIVDYGVIGLLIFMSILSFTFFIERILFFRKVDILSFAHIKKLENSLTKNLTTIATIASNAPYIGLLGTVLAIMQTFIDMGTADIVATKIMSSLALALKTTAIGLFVAIAAVVFYNILSRKVEIFLAEYESEKV